MRKLTAIIHIGTEKTGTTTLQRTLYDNRESLLATGVYYLSGSEKGTKFNSRYLAAACIDVADDFLQGIGITSRWGRGAYRKRVVQGLSYTLEHLPEHVHTIIISSEHFHSRLRDVVAIKRLKGWLSPYVTDFRVVCYLRRQVDMVASFYSTYLRTGGSDEFVCLMERMLRSDNSYVNYEEMLNRWKQVFGSQVLTARLYDPQALLAGSVVQDFYRANGLNVEAAAITPPDMNVSVNHLGQVLLRELNGFTRGCKRKDVRAHIIEIRKIIVKTFSGKGEQLGKFHAAKLQQRFAIGNDAVRTCWFPDRKKLFSDEFGDDTLRMISAQEEKMLRELFVEQEARCRQGKWLDTYSDVLHSFALQIEQENPERARELSEFVNSIRSNNTSE